MPFAKLRRGFQRSEGNLNGEIPAYRQRRTFGEVVMKNVRLTVLASLVGIFGLAAGSASATVKDLDAIFGGPLSAFSAPHFGLYNPSVTTEAPTGTFEDWWHFNVAET